MGSEETRNADRRRRARRWSGAAAIVGTLLAVGLPWIQIAVFGTRPYVTSAFDAGSLVGWVLMLAGLGGVSATIGDRFGRLGRASVAATAVGMAIVSALLVRRTALFVEAGFRAVPATGEDPAGLLLSMATLLGLTLTVAGAGGIGLALRRGEKRASVTSWLLLLAPAIPLVLIAADLLFGLPLPLARLLVRTNAVLIPLGLGWLALGVRLVSHTRPHA
ncbi:hypothetical protein [Halorubrum sp. CSM-61]|uniref:hypothetical protein n=1 Tax=Halorubrum sp. CSM-61 TaxID=2485838 RepID=UPI000F4C7875|nr:hypothetical protein [Halorubrum sp. CSM-61]